MNKIKQKIAALSVASTMLLSSSGCKKDNLKLEYNEETKQDELSGKANYDAILNYYVVEIENIDKSISKYLVWKHDYSSNFYDVGSNMVMLHGCNSSDGYNYVSNLGIVVSIIPFSYFLPCYNMVKSNYSGEEIYNIFQNVKNDYEKFQINEEQKIFSKTK